MIESEELNRLWRNEEITPEEMKEELLEHSQLRQYEVERLAVICGKNARQTIRDLYPTQLTKRCYTYRTDLVREYVNI